MRFYSRHNVNSKNSVKLRFCALLLRSLHFIYSIYGILFPKMLFFSTWIKYSNVFLYMKAIAISCYEYDCSDRECDSRGIIGQSVECPIGSKSCSKMSLCK